jgi:predicted peroxiredoxin
MFLSIKTVSLLAIALAAILPAGAIAETIIPAPKPIVAPSISRGLFVVVASEEPMTQMMAMVLSMQTIAQGRSVRVQLCGLAGNLALKASSEKLFKPLNKSPQMLLRDMIVKGVTVEVRPLFSPEYNKTPSDFIDGVTIAKPPAVAAAMAEDGIKLFTF